MANNNTNNIENLCRVCMGVASRNMFRNHGQGLAVTALSIFGHPGSSSAPAPVSSFDKLVEKLRYVSMIKIEDQDNYPKMMCDLCIIQLNVAYNFKRLAIETSSKLDQYVIESGINNNISHIGDNNHRLESRHSAVFTPAHVKTEVDDGDNLSEITIQTNTDGGPPNLDGSGGQPSSSSSNSSSQQFSQFDSQSITMVQIGTRNNIQSATHSDIDFINNYLPVEHSRHTYSTTSNNNGLIVANAKTLSNGAVVRKISSSAQPNKSSTPITHKPRQTRELVNLNTSRSEFRPAVNPGIAQRHLLRSRLNSFTIQPNYNTTRRNRSQSQNTNRSARSNVSNTNHSKATKQKMQHKHKSAPHKPIRISSNDLFSFARP